jgi:hypothetical protein
MTPMTRKRARCGPDHAVDRVLVAEQAAGDGLAEERHDLARGATRRVEAAPDSTSHSRAVDQSRSTP